MEKVNKVKEEIKVINGPLPPKATECETCGSSFYKQFEINTSLCIVAE